MPNVATNQSGHTLLVDLRGDWRLTDPRPRFEGLAALPPSEPAVRSVGFDATGLGTWDSSLLTFLVQGMDYCEAHGLAWEEEGLPEAVRRLLELARAVPERDVEPGRASASFLAGIGARVLASAAALIAAVSFIGEVATGLAGLAVRRVRMRWRHFWVVVQANSSGALPIITLISFLGGLILAFLGAVVLRRFGAGYYVSYLVGYGMLRELGALMAGVLMAGRSGAGFAAELGSMKITEEIDALETLGISPVDHLVLPRLLGLSLAMPLLTLYAMAVGILGGMAVAVAFLDLSVTQFVTGLLTPVTLMDGLLGVFKGTVFGLIVGITGCLRGMQTGSDAGAVGRSATSAVVTGITWIIVANAVIDWVAALLEI